MGILNSININIILNIITILLIIFFIYKLIEEYYYYNTYKDENLLSSTDFDTICLKYQNTDLYKKYSSLTDEEKEFLYYLITSNKLKHKEEKPQFNKVKDNLKSQLGYSILITLLLKRNIKAMVNALQFNTLLQFASTYL